MRRLVLASSLALAATAASAQAADLNNQLGLIVSGVVDQWVGVQTIDGSAPESFFGGDDTVFSNGGAGYLSLPLGENLSLQSDVKYEYNSYATEAPGDNDVVGPRYSFTGAGHLSWRDPSLGLFGLFGGAGTTDFTFQRQDVAFVGGEAQVYLDNITLYAQGGYVDFDLRNASGSFLQDGVFVRGVLRWFMANDSRLQLEGTYLNVDFANSSNGDMEAVSAGARYDFTLAGLPLFGDVPLFVGYRGIFRDNCRPQSSTSRYDIDDHTIMIGTSYSFSGDRIAVDRRGATLSTPDFNYSCLVLG